MYFSLIFISFTPPCIPFSDGLLCIFPNRSISVSVYSPFHRQWIVKYVRNLKSVYTHSATINKHLNTQSRCEQREHTHTQKHAIKSWMHNRVSPCPTSPLVRLCIGDQFAYVCYCVFVFICVWQLLLLFICPHNRLYVQLMWCAHPRTATHTHIGMLTIWWNVRKARDVCVCVWNAMRWWHCNKLTFNKIIIHGWLYLRL